MSSKPLKLTAIGAMSCMLFALAVATSAASTETAETPEATPSPVSSPVVAESPSPTPKELVKIDAKKYKKPALAWETKAKKALVRLSWLRLALAKSPPDKLKARSSFSTWKARYSYYRSRSHDSSTKAGKLWRQMKSSAWLNRPIYDRQLKQFIIYYAKKCKVDPAATLAVASYEGKFHGLVGDNGSSFGPWQLHRGGALPKKIRNPERWANSPKGIMYALRGQAKVAKNLRGYSAIHTIVWRFEKPTNKYAAVNLARGHYKDTKPLVAKTLSRYRLK